MLIYVNMNDRHDYEAIIINNYLKKNICYGIICPTYKKVFYLWLSCTMKNVPSRLRTNYLYGDKMSCEQCLVLFFVCVCVPLFPATFQTRPYPFLPSKLTSRMKNITWHRLYLGGESRGRSAGGVHLKSWKDSKSLFSQIIFQTFLSISCLLGSAPPSWKSF